MKKFFLLSLVVFGAAITNAQSNKTTYTTLFNNNWQFIKDADTSISQQLFNHTKNSIAWQQINLPHTANIEPVIKTNQQWQGISFYRKFFTLNKSDAGKHIAIHVDAAMFI